MSGLKHVYLQILSKTILIEESYIVEEHELGIRLA